MRLDATFEEAAQALTKPVRVKYTDRPKPSGRSGAGAGRATRPSGLHRSRPASGWVGGGERPPEVD